VIKWIYKFDGSIAGNVAVGNNGQILAATEKGLYCIDPNGILLWAHYTDTELTSSPSLGPDQTTYVGDANGILHAVDSTGVELWTFATDGPIYGAPAVSDNDLICVASEDGTLYALDKNGLEQWRFQTWSPSLLKGAVLASPTIGLDGLIYTGGLYDPNLYALSPDTGDVRWIDKEPAPATGGGTGRRTRTLADLGNQPVLRSKRTLSHPVVNNNNGMIYQIALQDPNLYAFNPSDGMICWRTNLIEHEMIGENMTSESGWCEPAIGPDGTIYASLNDPYIRAVEPNDGTIKWVVKLEDAEGFHLVVDSTGYIYAAGDGGHLYVLTPDGQLIASMHTDGKLGYPVIARDHQLLLTYNEVRVSETEVESESRIIAITDESIVLQWEGNLVVAPNIPETSDTEENGHNRRR
jgi:outer membrane protein assembly factor BamB